MKPYLFSIDIYSCKVHFIITDNLVKDLNKLKKMYKKKEIKPGEYAGYLYTEVMTDYYVIISTNHMTWNTVSHEIFHLTHAIAEDRAIEDEESQAWICGHVTQKIYNYLVSKGIELSGGE